MNAKIAILFALVAVVVADGPRYRPRYDSHSFESNSFESYESDEAQYNFDWAVQHGPSGNNFGQEEGRDGDNTQGSYYVNLPDGRRQTVTYFVDGDSGYIADVKYDGSASFESGSSSFESYERPSFESYERPRYG